MANGSNETPQASVDRVRQEVERWIDVARTAGERTLEAIGMTPASRGNFPAVDVLETPHAFEVWLEVPGLARDAVQLTATETQLTIKLSRPNLTDAVGQWILKERPTGNCERSVHLSAAIQPDQTHAELRDGLLHVTLKKQSQPEPRTVPVHVV